MEVERWESLDEEAQALAQRGETLGDPDLLAQAEQRWRAALRTAPCDERSRLEGNAASALRARALLEDDPRGLDDAAALHGHALRIATSELDRAMHEYNLGLDLSGLAGIRRDLGAMDAAISAHRAALNHRHDREDHALFLGGLADALAERCDIAGDVETLVEAIDRYHEALKCPADDADRAHLLEGLGLAHADRYQSGSPVSELDAAIDALSAAVAAAETASGQLKLGDAHQLRFQAAGNVRDRDAASTAWRRAERLGADADELAYRLHGSSGDVDARLARLTAAVDDRRSTGPSRADGLARLASLLMTRSLRTGRWADLDEAIDRWREALATPGLGRRRATVLVNLSNALAERATRTGGRHEIAEALQLRSEALELLPDHSPLRAVTLADQATDTLSAGIAERPDDALRDANALTGEAVDLAREPSPERLTALSVRARCLRERYRHRGDIADLDAAIECWEEAIPLADGFTAALLCDNVGAALVERHSRSGATSDLNRAIDVTGTALEHLPPNSDERIIALQNLATGLHRRWQQGGLVTDLGRAVATWESASAMVARAGAHAAVGYALGLEREWATLWTPLVDGLCELAAESPDAAAGLRWRAIAAAESGKSRLLARTIALGDIPPPADVPAADAAREASLLAELRALDSADLGRAAVDAAHGVRARRRDEVRLELERLWEGIARLGAAASDYVALRRGDATRVEDVQDIARDLGPATALVVLFASIDRSWAFVVRGGSATAVAVCAALSVEDWAAALQRLEWQVANFDPEEPLTETWDAPVLPWLAEIAPHLEGADRVVISPDAAAHLMPWAVLARRARWRARDGGAMPLVTVPSLGVLTRLRRRPSRGQGAFVAGDPRGDLDYAAQEAREVAATLGVRPVIGEAATSKRLAVPLATARIVHLATHAYFVRDAPLESGIVTSDGVITARELLLRRVRAELVVISACESGVGGPLAGAELAGLAHAMLHAGARGAVVSLWKVDDAATGQLMRRFHECRLDVGDSAAALAAAQSAAADQDLATHYWAAFVFVGAWEP